MEDRNLYGKAVGLDQRGRHRSFGSAVDAAFKDLVTERGGIIFLYVRSAPILFSLRPKLRAMARRLAALPGAPKRVDLRLEIHSR